MSQQPPTLAISLLIPIALMPLASVLCLLGQGDQVWQQLAWQAGSGLFALLPLLITIQLAGQLQHEPFALQPLNASMAWLLLSSTLHGLAPELHHYEMLSALIAGTLSARLHPWLARLRLPPMLYSFKGPAIVIMLNCLACLLTLLPLLPLLRWLEPELLRLGHHWLTHPDRGFVLGFIYQLTTPFGMNRLFHLLATAHGGMGQEQISFVAAFYAVQLFGLPGMALALLARNDSPHRHLLQIGGLLLTLSTLISGVTAPLLLVLLLLSPALFCLHAVLAGVVMSFCLEIPLSFTIPALTEDLTPLHINELPLLHPQFLLLALVTLAVYYFASRMLLQLWPVDRHFWQEQAPRPEPESHTDLSLLAVGYLKALGGIGNLRNMDASLTYMTVEVESPELIDEQALIRLGVLTRFALDDCRLQLLVGPVAEQLASKLRSLAARQAIYLQHAPAQIAPFSLH